MSFEVFLKWKSVRKNLLKLLSSFHSVIVSIVGPNVMNVLYFDARLLFVYHSVVMNLTSIPVCCSAPVCYISVHCASLLFLFPAALLSFIRSLRHRDAGVGFPTNSAACVCVVEDKCHVCTLSTTQQLALPVSSPVLPISLCHSWVRVSLSCSCLTYCHLIPLLPQLL